MRVALCLSGAPRLEQGCLANQAACLGGEHGFDVFAYVWSGWGHSDEETAHEIATQLAPSSKSTSIHMEKEYLHGGAMPTSNISDVKNPLTIFKMYYAIMKADEMRRRREIECSFSYDIVIRSRVDIMLSHSIDFKYMRDAINPDMVVFPNNGHYRNGLNDRFAIGSSESMKNYSSAFCYIYNHINSGCLLHPESILRFHLRYMKMVAAISDFSSIIIKNGTPMTCNNNGKAVYW